MTHRMDHDGGDAGAGTGDGAGTGTWFDRSRAGSPGPVVVPSPGGADMAAACGAPLIGIACDSGQGAAPFDGQVRRHSEAVERTVGGIPVLLPNGLGPASLTSLIMRLDGLILTGAETDLPPAPYAPAGRVPRNGADAARSAAAVQMIQTALSSAIPFLGICSGLQELNVAFDGTLNPALHGTPGLLDHRVDRSGSVDTWYAPVHEIRVEGPVLDEILAEAGVGRRPRVNSLHGRGIDRLAPDLTVEARAPDGVIEAVSITDAPCFAMAVQWHPEWAHDTDPLSRALYGAFARAARQRRGSQPPHRAPATLESLPVAG
ncbi:MAG: gamma-glutamyl-gamma-aminobutyrate hydrolase family protein [Azospirillaceae bacterium]